MDEEKEREGERRKGMKRSKNRRERGKRRDRSKNGVVGGRGGVRRRRGG